jgi:acyl-CoA thioesterase
VNGHEYDLATAVRPTGDHTYAADLHDGWDIGGVPNGGYLLTVAGRALAQSVERPDPLTVTCHYLAPARSGPIELTTELVRAGRRHATAMATVRQDGNEVARVIGTFGDLQQQRDGRHLATLKPPEIPPPDECVHVTPIPDHPQSPPPITEKVSLRIAPEDLGFALGAPHGRAEIKGWAEFADGRDADTSALPLFADAFPPTVFNAGFPIGWMPTIELTVHVRKRPARGLLLCEFRTNLVSNGYMEVDGVIFDATGEVAAMSRQLAATPRGQT